MKQYAKAHGIPAWQAEEDLEEGAILLKMHRENEKKRGQNARRASTKVKYEHQGPLEGEWSIVKQGQGFKAPVGMQLGIYGHRDVVASNWAVDPFGYI